MRKNVIYIGAIFLGIAMLSLAWGKSESPTRKFTLLSTGDLSEIYYPQLGARDAKTVQEIEKQIKKEKRSAKYPVMLIDTGNFIGPSVIAETTYVPRPVRLFGEVGYTAVNVASPELIVDEHKIQKWQGEQSSPYFVSNIQNRKTAARLTLLSATTQLDNLRLRIFGVTTMQHIRALRDLLKKYSTSAEVDHVKAGIAWTKEFPELCLVLSDLPAKENNTLAQQVPEVDIILERGGNSPGSARQVNKALIAPSGNANGIGVLTVELDPTQLQIRTYSHAIVPFSPPPRKRELLPLLMETAPSAKSPLPPLPTIGKILPRVEMLRDLSVDHDRSELVRRRNPIPALARENKDVYFYDLYKGTRQMARAFYVAHELGRGNMTFNIIVAVKPENRLAEIHFITPPLVAGHSIGFEALCHQLIGKATTEWQYEKDAVAGAEESFLVLLDDLKTVLTVNERIEQNRLP